MNLARLSCLLAPLLGGCASAPAHYYTLIPEADQGQISEGASEIGLEVRPVRVPAQVDRLEIVTRQSGGDGMSIVEDERWIAPVADELRHALYNDLVRRLGAPSPSGRITSQLLDVKLTVDRFESSVSRYALIEGSWSLEIKESGRQVRIQCRTRAYEPVKGGYPELVGGYQRAVEEIARQIANVAKEARGEETRPCPIS